MKYKIVVDSSSDLSKDFIGNSEIGFSVVPLTIRLGEKEYSDDDNLNANEMLAEMKKAAKCASACPSPGDFLNEFTGEEYTVCITISSKLSGTYNSACVAAQMAAEEGKKVMVIDSKSMCGTVEVLAKEAFKLMKEGSSFENTQSRLEKLRDSRFVLFVIQSFDMVIKTGRMKKLTALIANVLNIKPLCMGDDGEVKIKEKIRTTQKSMERLTEVVGEFTENKTEDRVCVISECDAKEEAAFVEKLIKTKYNFKEVIVRKMHGIASFYAQRKGVIVCF